MRVSSIGKKHLQEFIKYVRPNTCVVEEIPETSHKYWTECKYWTNREICGINSIIRYECCEGYIQVEGKPGCTGVKPMSNVLDTARDLGATKFVEYLIRGGFSQQLIQGEKAVTLFAPTNEAFKAMDLNYISSLEESINERRSPYLGYHIIENKLLSRELHGNNEAETLYSGKKLRISRFGNGMMTVDCALVVRKDQQATNGIVHLIDKVLVPPPSRGLSSIPEIIFTDGRFREMAQLMIETNYVNELRANGPFTILAPTDETFYKMRENGISFSNNKEAKRALLKNHIIPHAVCPSVVIDKHHLTTLGGGVLELHCNKSGLYANDAKLKKETLIASNGMIQVLENVIIPDRARSLEDLMKKNSDKIDIFLKILKKANMESILNSANLTVTIFAPSDAAFETLDESELNQLMSDVEKARELINYHVVHGRHRSDNIADNQKVLTLDRQNHLRLKVYRKAIGIESAVVKRPNIEGENGILHIVDKVLTQPSTSILEVVETTGDFSMFADAIHRVRREDPKFLSMESKIDTTFTLFAPVNKAFHKLHKDKLRSLMRNKRNLKKVIQNHVVDNMYSTGSFKSQLMYDLKTEFQTVHVHKEKGELMVNDAHVIESDVLATDGIIHCIDKVLLPETKRKSKSMNSKLIQRKHSE
ncbi:transforming growth factor-beta-induced protein ig-h3-like isoform X2 [Centruroides sculpturatus]|uniref:transforming growth factor-beta-induced protein ig-h3-like isoform X2 n=1 Tax=Centruroides sculpturatus TaxID=218467 RepID=UPI000C6E48C1|nr:transforming growth factor-beta-induced protein ig-h3-like isoform X2 [Centruroides sculpturatus]